MNLKPKRVLKGRGELWGHRLEFGGLLVVLVATLWQAGLSGWWDTQLFEWQYLIQEDVNLSVLASMQDLTDLELEQNQERRLAIRERIRERTSRTVNNAISERDGRRQAMNNGQAAWMSEVRALLLMLGAGLFVAGKWRTLSAVEARARAEARTEEPPESGSNHEV